MKHEVLIWEGESEGLYESKHNAFMGNINYKFTPDELSHLKESTKEIFLSLTAREAKILRPKFDRILARDVNLEDVGRQFDVTRKRIREIEAKALRKINERKESKQKQCCSFCNKSVDEVKKMIASEVSNVFICDECIKNCGDLLDE